MLKLGLVVLEEPAHGAGVAAEVFVERMEPVEEGSLEEFAVLGPDPDQGGSAHDGALVGVGIGGLRVGSRMIRPSLMAAELIVLKVAPKDQEKLSQNPEQKEGLEPAGRLVVEGEGENSCRPPMPSFQNWCPRAC